MGIASLLPWWGFLLVGLAFAALVIAGFDIATDGVGAFFAGTSVGIGGLALVLLLVL